MCYGHSTGRGSMPARLSNGAARDARRVTDAIGQLASRRPVLSGREHEVATLIVQGFSSREIAEALVVGERTVDTHVHRILNELGFASRTQMAAWSAGVRAAASPNRRPSRAAATRCRALFRGAPTGRLPRSISKLLASRRAFNYKGCEADAGLRIRRPGVQSLRARHVSDHVERSGLRLPVDLVPILSASRDCFR